MPQSDRECSKVDFQMGEPPTKSVENFSFLTLLVKLLVWLHFSTNLDETQNLSS